MRQYVWFKGSSIMWSEGVEALSDLLKSPSAAARAVAAIVAETEQMPGMESPLASPWTRTPTIVM
jgi:hypothetical protein